MASPDIMNSEDPEEVSSPVDLAPYDWQEQNRRQIALLQAVTVYGEVAGLTSDATGIANDVLTIAARFEEYLRAGSGSDVRETEGSGEGE